MLSRRLLPQLTPAAAFMMHCQRKHPCHTSILKISHLVRLTAQHKFNIAYSRMPWINQLRFTITVYPLSRETHRFLPPSVHIKTSVMTDDTFRIPIWSASSSFLSLSKSLHHGRPDSGPKIRPSSVRPSLMMDQDRLVNFEEKDVLPVYDAAQVGPGRIFGILYCLIGC